MEGSKTVFVSPKAKRVSLQRYLWSRVAYEDEPASFRVLGGLLLNQIWLEGKCGTDKEFRQKFAGTLEVSSRLLRELNLSNGLSQQAYNRLRKRIITELEGFLVPRRNYAQWKSRFDNFVQLKVQKPLGVPTKNIPPKGFIGKGYGDKGTARKPELDGSPSWQEVAQSNQNLDRRIHELIEDAKREPKFREKLKIQKEAARLIQEREHRRSK